MKILYIALKFDYGDPLRGFSFEHYNFYDTLVHMNNKEHDVIYFPFDEIMLKKGEKGMNRELLKVALEERPDLCFFFLFKDEIERITLEKITKRAMTFNWFADDHWRFRDFSRHYAPLFSWVATTDSKAPKKYYCINCKNVIKTQWACNHFLYKPSEFKNYRYGVSFVGQPHGNRPQIINVLRKHGTPVECFGYGWPRGKISQGEMINVFSESEINLNITNSSTTTLGQISRIFFKRKGSFIVPQSIKEIVSNIHTIERREQIKGRNFEVPGCGGFLLTGDADNLRDYYQDWQEIVIFKNTSDLISKVEYYLANEKERKKVANAGYLRTIREHTYEKRFNEIFKAMDLTC